MKKGDCTGRLTTRTKATIAAYQDRVEKLRVVAEREQHAGGDVLELIDWFCAQHERWSSSTIRQYRAALRLALETTRLHPDWRPVLEARLQNAPLPKTQGPRRTSAKKRKSLPVAEFERIETALWTSGKVDDLLIRGFMIFGTALFLRPVEYLSVRVENATLIVQNAKATNGRANGVQRERDISQMGPNAIAALVTFVGKLNKAAARAGSYKRLHNRLSTRLARVCKALNIARISLYTLRHVGMASAKSWMEPVEVAAASGHASVRTATTHYAKKSSGWVDWKPAGKPSLKSIAAVRSTLKAFAPQQPLPHDDPVMDWDNFDLHALQQPAPFSATELNTEAGFGMGRF